MSPTTTSGAGAATPQTMILRADEDYLKDMDDSMDKVLGNALMAQTVLINYYEDKIDTFQTPHLRDKLAKFHDKAQEHKEKLEQMFGMLDKDPSKMKQMMGTMMTKMMEGMANMRGLGVDPYPDLQQLMMLELMSTGAFGIIAQSGAAIGHDQVHEQALTVVSEKFEHWRFLQESAMMYSTVAIFEKRPI